MESLGAKIYTIDIANVSGSFDNLQPHRKIYKTPINTGSKDVYYRDNIVDHLGINTNESDNEPEQIKNRQEQFVFKIKKQLKSF